MTCARTGCEAIGWVPVPGNPGELELLCPQCAIALDIHLPAPPN